MRLYCSNVATHFRGISSLKIVGCSLSSAILTTLLPHLPLLSHLSLFNDVRNAEPLALLPRDVDFLFCTPELPASLTVLSLKHFRLSAAEVERLLCLRGLHE